MRLLPEQYLQHCCCWRSSCIPRSEPALGVRSSCAAATPSREAKGGDLYAGALNFDRIWLQSSNVKSSKEWDYLALSGEIRVKFEILTTNTLAFLLNNGVASFRHANLKRAISLVFFNYWSYWRTCACRSQSFTMRSSSSPKLRPFTAASNLNANVHDWLQTVPLLNLLPVSNVCKIGGEASHFLLQIAIILLGFSNNVLWLLK